MCAVLAEPCFLAADHGWGILDRLRLRALRLRELACSAFFFFFKGAYNTE